MERCRESQARNVSSPRFCIPGCESTQKARGKDLGEKRSKRHHKVKDENNFSIKLQHSTKKLTT